MCEGVREWLSGCVQGGGMGVCVLEQQKEGVESDDAEAKRVC